MKKADLAALGAALEGSLRHRMAGRDQEDHNRHVLRLIEAGIRYGWASRGLFEIRPLKQEKVDGVMEEIVRAYMQSGFPRYGRTDE